METESSPTRAGGKFKNVLSKARRGLNDNSSSGSINDPDRNSGVRSSIDSTVERIKTRATGNSSQDDAEKSTGGAMSKLIPKGIKKKRKQQKEVKEAEETDQPRGRSIGDRSAMGVEGFQNGSSSQTTLDEDGDSSLITYDSETESPVTTPPPLVSHQSHVGYLTSTSPLIKTSIDQTASSTKLAEGPESTDTHPTFRSSTFAAAKSPSTVDKKLAPRHASTIDPLQNGSSLSVDSVGANSRSRSVSPGAKLREAFSPTFRKKEKEKDGTSKESSSSAVPLESGSGNTLGGLFSKGDGRASFSSQRNSKATDHPMPMPSTIQTQASANNNSLPTIATAPPQTPPASASFAPETTVTPPTPTDPKRPSSPPKKAVPAATNGGNGVTITSPSGNMISHRRVRSDSGPATHPPSKLSNMMSTPLTPTIEEGKNTGSRTPSGNQSVNSSSGFFSSVFVAAQNAATTLTNSMGNSQTRSRSGTGSSDVDENKPVDTSLETAEQSAPIPPEQVQQRAIDTIGTGDLNLSHLGISNDAPSTSGLSSNVFAASDGGSITGIPAQYDEAAARAEDASASRAVSLAYEGKPVDDAASTVTAEDVGPIQKPRSIADSSITGLETPPNGSIFEGEGSIRRSGSVRSRVGAVAGVARKHRNNSGTVGNVIGAATNSSHAALSSPQNGSTPKLTGFAVASKKRNRDFHQLFRSVPEDDYLIEDYSCALQRDIILTGRIYISEGHVCFSSNILGWVTTLVISFDEVVSVEKENTAMVFPNAIAIQTLHARHTYRTLLSREATYDLLIGIWKINHPGLKSSENGVRLSEGDTGNKTEKVDISGSEDDSEGSGDDEAVYDEDDEDDDAQGSFTEQGEGSLADSEIGDTQTAVSRKASALGVAAGKAAGGVPTESDTKGAEKAAAVAAVASVDYPGPQTHAPTECIDQDSHYDKLLKDEVIPAPLGKIYSMVFGPASGGFMARWLVDEEKCEKLEMEDDKKGLSEENKTRTYSYIKPLNSNIGPKQTKCIITEVIEMCDLEKAISVVSTTQTPDVPSGNVFSTKTKYCLMWAPGNATRFVMNCTIEWTGKSWLKGPIEKGANDGQTLYAEHLVKALKAGVSSRPRAGTVGSKAKTKGKRRKGDPDFAKNRVATSRETSPQLKSSSWGPFEPLHGPLSPIADIISPLISSSAIIGILLILLLSTWFRGWRSSSSKGGIDGYSYPQMNTPQRLAAYEQLWRNEEAELWSWLESRAGVEAYGTAYPTKPDQANRDGAKRARKERAKVLKGSAAAKTLEDVKMGMGIGEREIREALRVTEEKLSVLKEVVSRGTERPSGFERVGETVIDDGKKQVEGLKEEL